ncbi:MULTISPECIES: hypothetical protein [unclassified Streptomyces]|uniref:hypothetical protein n=1 Tax=unclassified Streptomyces TaxID=2593676 RepID=UPI00343D8D38
MATFGYAGLPAPGGGDAPTGNGQLAELALAVDPHLWQHVEDLADRNATLSGAPTRTVAIALDGTVWAKTSSAANTWVTIWEPPPAWRTLPLSSGYEAGTTVPQIKVVGRQAFTRGRVVRTDGTLIVGTDGVQVATVPGDCIPEQLSTVSAFFSLTGPPLIGVGRSEVLSRNESAPGALRFFSQDGAQDGGTVGATWVDLAGYYWLD